MLSECIYTSGGGETIPSLEKVLSISSNTTLNITVPSGYNKVVFATDIATTYTTYKINNTTVPPTGNGAQIYSYGFVYYIGDVQEGDVISIVNSSTIVMTGIFVLSNDLEELPT